MTTGHPSADVVVFGSANLDVTLSVQRFPRSGETLLALNQSESLGGKGANQAVACQRAGRRTALIAAVGDDAAGETIVSGLVRTGVDVGGVRRVLGKSGAAYIMVDDTGENSIVVAAGANATLTSLTATDIEAIHAAQLLVLQCEVPIEGLRDASDVASASGTRVLLNAAPAQRLPESVLSAVEILVVNEHEARTLTGHEQDSPEQLAIRLAGIVPQAVVTLGSKGVVWSGRLGTGHHPAPVVNVVDTTAAGDTFVGYLAAALAGDNTWLHCIQAATAAAALAVQRRGAVDSIPDGDDVHFPAVPLPSRLDPPSE